MANEQAPAVNGGGFGGLLFLLFLGLKLGHVISWPWIWVFAPLWIPLGLVVLCAIIFGIVVLAKG